MYSLAICMFYLKNVYLDLLSIFNWVIWGFASELPEFFIYSHS